MAEGNAMSSSAVEDFRGAIQAGDIALVQAMLQSQPTLGMNAVVNAAVFGANAVKVENFLRDERIYLDSDGGDSDGGALLLFAAVNRARPGVWGCLVHWREERRQQIENAANSSNPNMDFHTKQPSRDNEMEGCALKLALLSRHWDLVEHLLAQYDSDRCHVRVVDLLHDVIRREDEKLALGFLRRGAVERSLQGSTSQLKPCSTRHDVVRMAISLRLLPLMEELERFESFRSLLFTYCYDGRPNYGCCYYSSGAVWNAFLERYRDEETWKHTRMAFLARATS